MTTTVTIKDISVTQELSKDAARNIVGGMINLREEGVSPTRPPAGEPHGGAGYTGILIHYKLTVIE
jgi:hypothetical protein